MAVTYAIASGSMVLSGADILVQTGDEVSVESSGYPSNERWVEIGSTASPASALHKYEGKITVNPANDHWLGILRSATDSGAQPASVFIQINSAWTYPLRIRAVRPAAGSDDAAGEWEGQTT